MNLNSGLSKILPDHVCIEFNQLEVATTLNVCDNLISFGLLLSTYTCRKLYKVFDRLPMGENNLWSGFPNNVWYSSSLTCTDVTWNTWNTSASFCKRLFIHPSGQTLELFYKGVGKQCWLMTRLFLGTVWSWGSTVCSGSSVWVSMVVTATCWHDHSLDWCICQGFYTTWHENWIALQKCWFVLLDV